ncbi:MAG: phosphatidylglycerophosphatase A [Pseudomonadota bacterium]|nr:MAG: phosphatidylglycerophosphatase A [Pseudomonadota bacterium]
MNRMQTRRVALGSLDGWLAFGFGSGLSPVAPGTAGSLVAVVPALGLACLPMPLALACVALGFGFGVWLCARVGRRLGVHDHSGIVFDEFVGLWLVLVLLPFEWPWWLAGFALFRLFDAAKPWPIGWLDRHVHGGLGVMLDDVLAALMSLALLLPAAAWPSAG